MLAVTTLIAFNIKLTGTYTPSILDNVARTKAGMGYGALQYLIYMFCFLVTVTGYYRSKVIYFLLVFMLTTLLIFYGERGGALIFFSHYLVF